MKDKKMLRLLGAMDSRPPAPLWLIAVRARRGILWTRRQMRAAIVADYLDYECRKDIFLYSLSPKGAKRFAQLSRNEKNARKKPNITKE